MTTSILKSGSRLLNMSKRHATDELVLDRQQKRRRVSFFPPQDKIEQIRSHRVKFQRSVDDKSSAMTKTTYKKAKDDLINFLTSLSKCDAMEREQLVSKLIRGVQSAARSAAAATSTSVTRRERGLGPMIRHHLKEMNHFPQRNESLRSRDLSRENHVSNQQNHKLSVSSSSLANPTHVQSKITERISNPIDPPSVSLRSINTTDTLHQQEEKEAPDHDTSISMIGKGTGTVTVTSPKTLPKVISIDMTKSNTRQETSESRVHIQPTDQDIVGGRGNGTKYHKGNVAFRQLIQSHKMAYIHCYTAKEKRAIVLDIMKQVRDRGGRFLKKVIHESEENDAALSCTSDTNNCYEEWVEMDDSAICVKVAQALRENATELRMAQLQEKARNTCVKERISVQDDATSTSTSKRLDAAKALISLGS